MRFNLTPNRPQTMEQVKRAFATGDDARWRGTNAVEMSLLYPGLEQVYETARVLDAQQRAERLS